MAKHTTLTVGTTPVVINAAGTGEGRGQSMLVTSVGDIYIGDSSVTTTNYGFKVTPTTPLSADVSWYDTLYAVATGNTEVHVLYLGAS